MDKHTAQDARGRVKEAAGALTDDEDLRTEGRIDQAKAGVKKKVDDAAEALNRGIDRISGDD